MKKLFFVVIGLGIIFILIEIVDAKTPAETLKVESVRHDQGRVYVQAKDETQNRLIMIWDGHVGADHIVELIRSQNFAQISTVRKGVKFRLFFPPPASEGSTALEDFTKILKDHAARIDACSPRVEIWLY